MIAALLLAGILSSEPASNCDSMHPEVCLAAPLLTPDRISRAIEPNVLRVLAGPQSGFDSTAPEPCGPVQVQVAATVLVYSISAAADLYSTELALHNNPAAFETNPIGRLAGYQGRKALKVLMVGGAAWTDFTLRRKGHKAQANFLRAIVVIAHVGLVINNLDIAYSKRVRN